MSELGTAIDGWWQAWQEPPRFLEPIDVASCVVIASDGSPIPEVLHPLVYGTLGALVGAGVVGFIAMHEMKMFLARAKTLGFEVPRPLTIAPALDGEDAPPTAAGKKTRVRMGRTG